MYDQNKVFCTWTTTIVLTILTRIASQRLYILNGRMAGRMPLSSGFKIWRVFHLSLRFIIWVGHLAPSVYRLHKHDGKTETFTFRIYHSDI